MIRLNLNTVLFVLGGLAIAGPDFSAASAWLAASGIPHVIGIVHLLGYAATACGGLALAMPFLRKTLALLGLATPPGAQAPWNPSRDNVAPMIRVARTPDPGSVTVPVSRIDAETPVLPRKTK
jgi:hypothetical protein